MGRGLIFIRHAMSAVDSDVSSKDWGLTESAREDCVLLAHALPGRLAPVVFSSTELQEKNREKNPPDEG